MGASRGAAGRRQARNEGLIWTVMKSVLFWIFLGVASFAVGALIISPTWNALSSNRPSKDPVAASDAPASMQPGTPQSGQVVPAAAPQRTAGLSVEPDVEITPVHRRRTESARPRSTVDGNDAATTPAGDRRGRRRARSAVPVEAPTTDQPDDTRISAPDDTSASTAIADENPAPRRTIRRTRAPGRNRDTMSDSTLSVRPDRATGDAPKPRHRKVRSTRKPVHREATKPAAATDGRVQKGDTID